MAGSYVAFELDALNLVPHIARAAGIEEARVTHGLVQLWAYCFRAKKDVLSRVHLLGFFGSDAVEALEAFGFIEASGDLWRVKGASRYLRVAEGRSLGGKKAAAAGNLKRGQLKGGSWSQAGAKLGTSPSSSPAGLQLDSSLSPTTDDRSLEALPAVPATPKKKADPRHAATVRELCDRFESVRGIKYVWQGVKDAVALSGLLKHSEPERILDVWEHGLRAPGDKWASCNTVAQLAQKWNDLTATLAPPKPKPKALPLIPDFFASPEAIAKADAEREARRLAREAAYQPTQESA